MSSARTVRPVWIVLGLVAGFAAVLAGPVYLVWSTYISSTVSERDLTAVFQSVRYEYGGLIFRYTVHNRTRHAVDFQPALTEVKALHAKGQPSVGYPNILLPLELPGRGSHVVEVRLELPTAQGLPQSMSDEQTRQILESQPSSTSSVPTFADPPVSPLPMRGTMAPGAAAVQQFTLQETLSLLGGFVVEDETNGIRLVLPRGW